MHSILSQLLKFLADICIYHHTVSKRHSVAKWVAIYKHWGLLTLYVWHWFENYLSNHNHMVFIENSSLFSLPVLSGVPHCAVVLGPYVNDILNSILNSFAYLFVDDTKISRVIYVRQVTFLIFKMTWLPFMLVLKMELSLCTLKKMCHCVRFGHSMSDSSSKTCICIILSSKLHGLIITTTISCSGYHSLYLIIRRSFSPSLPVYI